MLKLGEVGGIIKIMCIFATDFKSEIKKRYARSCNRKCEKLPDCNARKYNRLRV